MRLDGPLVASTEVANAAFQDFTFTLPEPLPPAAGLDIVFTNDTTLNGEDRNLLVDTVRLNGLPLPIGAATYDLGSGAAAFDGLNTRAFSATAPWMPWSGALRLALGNARALHYIHTDPLGTPRLVSDTALRERWRWHADPFGAIPANPDPAGLGPFDFSLRFPGQFFDRETGMHYNYFRDCYDPGTGRFCQPDPIGSVRVHICGRHAPLASVARCRGHSSRHRPPRQYDRWPVPAGGPWGAPPARRGRATRPRAPGATVRAPIGGIIGGAVWRQGSAIRGGGRRRPTALPGR